MSEKILEQRINALEAKIDILLEEIQIQRSNRQEKEDLMKDLTLVGNDLFISTVDTLDKSGVEIDMEALTALLIKLARNVGTFNQMFNALESANDFIKDVSPIINQVGLDAIAKFAEYEQKGYLDFFKEAMGIMDNVITHFSTDDVKALADNVVTMLETIKGMTQPDMLAAMNIALTVYKNMDTDNIPQYSMWKAFRAMNSPEMKRGIGFMIVFMKNLSITMDNNQTNKN